MNRESKRNLTKQLKEKGYSKKDIDLAITFKEHTQNSIVIPEGQTVKLNYESITTNINYPRLTDKYKRWIEDHKDDIFTVEYDEKYKTNPSLVCLVEDDTEPKWLQWVGDLIIIPAQPEKE